MNNEFFTIYEFAKYLRVHPNTIRKAIKKGNIRAFRVNAVSKSSWRIHKSELERMAEFDLADIVHKMALKEKNNE
jgi:excisionase family DNA binding protein